jgi:preprotein translocase SecF subunit
LGALALANHLGLIDGEIDLTMIAVFLTIIGWSQNDTIVIFDRVRENLPRVKGSLAEVIDLSINQTLSRTLLAAGTTLTAVTILFLFNIGTRNVLESFTFAMLVGIVSGSYSTIFISCPVLLWLEGRRQAKESRSKGGAAQAA